MLAAKVMEGVSDTTPSLGDMEIDGLGILSNTIEKEEDDFSILALKKNATLTQ